MHINESAENYLETILNLSETGLFDAVLLDAPCSATGTIARHPELKYHRMPDDIIRLANLQKNHNPLFRL